MEQNVALAALSALAQPTRFQCVRFLVENGSQAATPLANALSIPANTLSAHLAILSRAGLVTSSKTGRQIIYSVAPHTVNELGRLISSLGAGKL